MKTKHELKFDQIKAIGCQVGPLENAMSVFELDVELFSIKSKREKCQQELVFLDIKENAIKTLMAEKTKRVNDMLKHAGKVYTEGELIAISGAQSF